MPNVHSNRSRSVFKSDPDIGRELAKSLPQYRVSRDQFMNWSSLTYVKPNQELPPLASSSLALEDQFCGWLWMRSGRFGRWRHRYFCLDGTMLSYFTSFPAEVFLKQAQTSVASACTSRHNFQFGDSCQPRGVIRVAHLDDTDRSNRVGFKVYGSCGKVIDIRAHDIMERNRWLRALKTPARRKSRSWSIGSSEEVTVAMSSFDSDGHCRFDRLSIPIYKSGWIKKKSSLLGLWKCYFFVYQGLMLSYYNSDKSYEVPQKRGYVESVKTRRHSSLLDVPNAGNTVASAVLELVITLGLPLNQVLHLRFRSVIEARDWRRVLQPDGTHYSLARK